MIADVVATPPVRLAGLQDLGQIMALENEAFPHGWSAQSWAEEITDHYVAVAGDGLGVIAMSEVAGTAELLRVIVSPEARGHGLGRSLVSHGLEWAQHFGAAKVFLEVSADNCAAIKLYESSGFAPVNRRADYYGPGDDGVVYCRVIVPLDTLVLPEPGSPSPANVPTAVSKEEPCPNR